MAEIKFSPDALRDLKEIKAYITDELCSPSSAAKIVGQIMNRIRQLSDFPALGAPLSSVIHMEVSYRFLVCGNYTAFYKVDDDEGARKARDTQRITQKAYRRRKRYDS